MSSFPSAPRPPSPDDPDPRIGTVVAEKWRLDRVLGRGGMATVYAAVHRNRSRVAIKVLHAGLPDEVFTRFLKEGYLNNIVEHPGAIHTLDDGVLPDGAAYLVMELLDGENLRERIDRTGPMALPDAARIATAVLDVLEAAHAAKIVHRDVKPDNVFLLRSGGTKLLDFGIARERILGAAGSETVVGLVMGSPGFMAPEQATGLTDEIDERTDLWAVAATLFFALTGRELRSGRTVEERLAMAMGVLPGVGLLAPALPLPVAAFLDRALAFDRGARFPSAGEMRRALVTAQGAALASPRTGTQYVLPPSVSKQPSASGLPAAGRSEVSSITPALGHELRRPAGEPRGTRKGVMWLAGMLVVGLVALAAFAAWPSPTPAAVMQGIAQTSPAVPSALEILEGGTTPQAPPTVSAATATAPPVSPARAAPPRAIAPDAATPSPLPPPRAKSSSPTLPSRESRSAAPPSPMPDPLSRGRN